MAINYPTSLDTLTAKVDNVDDVQAIDINTVQDICEALEAKVGVDSSAVTTSLDYLVTNTNSNDPGHTHTTILPRSYLVGLQLSNDTDSDHDIAITTGICRDSTDSCNLALSSILTKQIDAAFAAGDDAGGLFSGSVAADTWYHVFLIRKDSDGTIDAGFDTDVDAANIPSGYTEYRRVGSALTDGSANILGFTQIGDDFLWDDPPLDVNETDVDQSSAALKTLTVPIDVKVKAVINVYSERDDTNNYLYISAPDVNDEAPSITAAPLVSFMHHETGYRRLGGKMEVYTNTSGQIRVRGIDNDVDTFLISTLGYTDRRGRDD